MRGTDGIYDKGEAGIYLKDNNLGDRELLESLSRKLQEQKRIVEPFCRALDKLKFPNQELVQSSFYLPDRGITDAVVGSFASSLSGTVSKIDTSWIRQVNPWVTEVARFNVIDASSLIGLNTDYARLIKLEQETSKLALRSERISEITSTAVQLASIEKSLVGISAQWRNVVAPFQFLEKYSDFASRQYTLIQEAAVVNDDKATRWRLDLLDATSKFVDRQITWASDFALDIQEDVDSQNIPVIENEVDVAAIPQYIGYSKRDHKEIEEALAESTITLITEKGKLIVSKARLIQKICRLNNFKLLFSNTDLYLGSYLSIAGTFCRNRDSLESVVNALYQVFYSQKEAFSSFVKVDEYECLEYIRELRQQKNFPGRTKEITFLQNRLYDRFLELEDAVIEKIEMDLSCTQSSAPVAIMLSEDKWTEETVSKNIFKALLKVQGNRTCWGKKEDELNDCLRDALGMVYEMKDQTRQGISLQGKAAGEVDLQICRDGFPVALIEGAKVNSVERTYIQIHIDKVLTYYDPFGCPYVFVVIYTTAKKFADFWKNLLNYIREEYSFPYAVKEEIRELNHIYASSRHAKTVLLRDDRELAVHFFVLSMQ